METQDLRTLKILEAVAQEGSPSQRDLARRLDISLGLVNSFIKRLANKGYFKISTIPKNRVRYIMTPKGAAEKTRLTYEYIQYSYQFYKQSRGKLRSLFSEYENNGVRRIFFYGAGDLSEIASISLQETAIELGGIVDDYKHGDRFLGQRVLSPGRLRDESFDVVLITAVASREIIRERLLSMGIDAKKIALIQ